VPSGSGALLRPLAMTPTTPRFGAVLLSLIVVGCSGAAIDSDPAATTDPAALARGGRAIEPGSVIDATAVPAAAWPPGPRFFAGEPIGRDGMALALCPDLAPLLQAEAGEEKRDESQVSWETGDRKSWLIPAVEIVSFELLLNLHNRWFVDEEEYGSDIHSIRENLHTGWGVDQDPFETNQLWHPYAGATYFDFSRSAGLGFWESMAYTFLGSALWEVAGETTPPSLNDQISTGIGGSFLGEALFRLASLILEGHDAGKPDFWQELGAAVVSPPTWFNRHAFGDRFKTVHPSHDPAVFSRVGIGAGFNTHVSDRDLTDSEERGHGLADFRVDLGLPGQPGYHYDRPFDHFQFEGTFTTNAESHTESLSIRGLLVGTDYGSGEYDGVWGLYGGYDYLSPELFRFSSTALSLGTTGQWWVKEWLAFQGSAFAGVGYGASGTIADDEIDRDYHYGIVPQGLVDLRAIFGELAILDVSARGYYVSGNGSDDRGHENIARAQASLLFRLVDRHGVALQYVLSKRDAPDTPTSDRHQTVAAVRLVYTYLLGSAQGSLGAAGGKSAH